MKRGYKKLYCNNNNSNGYFFGTSENPTTSVIGLKDDNNNLYNDDLYSRVSKDNVSAYWIASPVSTKNEYVACVFSDSVYYQFYTRKNIGIRPVVCLPENIEANKIDNVWRLSY